MKKSEGVSIVATDQSGSEIDTSVLDQTGTAFDPTTVHLDLTKEEKRRTTALLLAIQAYQNMIIKDADMYAAICREQGRDSEPKIKPATMDALVMAAINFDDFISGRLQARINDPDEHKSGAPA
jgi:hypothetical protein